MKTTPFRLLLLLTVMLSTSSAFAGEPDRRDLMERIARLEPETIERQIQLCEIAAPPFGESERGELFRSMLTEIGLTAVRVDKVGNVIAELPGKGKGPTIVVSAHLDTVFPAGTDVTVRREGKFLRGPGIVDDCRGLAVVLAVGQVLQGMPSRPAGRVLLVGTVGEEGEGNLRGVRYLFDAELKDQVDFFISVDGTGGRLVHQAVGSHRYRVTFSGPGGHSFGAFGLPNPIHAAGRAIARIAQFDVPKDPKTTFSVGLLEGGTSVNSIPARASFSIDLRSIDPRQLDKLDRKFKAAVQEALEAEVIRWTSKGNPQRLKVDVTTLGERPAALQPVDSLLVRLALDAARTAGVQPELTAGSTDANLPMSRGVPAITIAGGGNGSGSHSLLEEFDTTGSEQGPQWALLLVLALANQDGDRSK